MDKPNSSPKKFIEVTVTTPPELTIPKFSNLVGSLWSKERGDVVLDFLFFDERLKKEEKVVGHQVAKIVITLNTAKCLRDLLNKIVPEEK